jgi:hypothetical protein
MRFTMTAQATGRILPPLAQQLAMRAGIVDILDILVAGHAAGRLQRAGVRIVLDSSQICVAIYASDSGPAMLAAVEFPDIYE